MLPVDVASATHSSWQCDGPGLSSKSLAFPEHLLFAGFQREVRWSNFVATSDHVMTDVF